MISGPRGRSAGWFLIPQKTHKARYARMGMVVTGTCEEKLQRFDYKPETGADVLDAGGFTGTEFDGGGGELASLWTGGED